MKKLNRKGFTLIELIVVIAIIAALMLILVPTMNGFTKTAKTQANNANARAVYTAIIASETGANLVTDTTKTKLCTNSTDTTGFVFSDFWTGTLKSGDSCTWDSTARKVTYQQGSDTTTKGTYPN